MNLDLRTDVELDPAELAADLVAAGIDADPSAWLSRPAIARRVALRLAQLLPATTDRLVVSGHGAPALAASLGLITGLSWATSDAAGAVDAGTIHPGESIAVVACLTSELRAGANAVADAGAAILVAVALLDDAAGKIEEPPARALFTRDSSGDLHEGDRA